MLRRLIVPAVAVSIVAALALPACGTKTDEATRAAGITPANALGLVSVNLEPSIDQKRNLMAIARRFPGAKEVVKEEFDETRDKLLGDLVSEVGLDFERDVRSWLGNEVALVVLAPEDGRPPTFVVLVHTTDTSRARAAMDKAAGDDDFDTVYRIVEDFVVLAEDGNERGLDAIERQAGKDDAGLARSERFTTYVDQLAGDRLVLAWVDVRAVVESVDELGEVPGFDVAGLLNRTGPAAIDVHAEHDAVVMQGVAKPFLEATGGRAELTAALPARTLGAFTFFNLGTTIDAVLSVVGGGDAEAEIERETGIDVREDILSWMEGEVVLVGGAVPEGRSFPDFALVVAPSDRGKAQRGLERVRAALRDRMGLELEERRVAGATAYVVPEPFTPGIQPAMALFEDRFVLANSPEYLEALAKDSSPGFASTSAYEATIGEGADRTALQMVIHLDAVREALEEALLGNAPSEDRAEYEREVKPNLEPLQAIGMVARHEGDFDRFEVKLTFD